MLVLCPVLVNRNNGFGERNVNFALLYKEIVVTNDTEGYKSFEQATKTVKTCNAWLSSYELK